MPGWTGKSSTYVAAALWQEDSKVEYGPNTKRVPSKSFDRYESYRRAATVGEALRLGSLPADLLFDFERGHLKVLEPLRKEPLDLFSVKRFDELTYTDKVLAKWVHLANVSDEDGKGKLIQKQLDDSLKKSMDNMRKDNARRLSKIETAKALDVKDVDDLADKTGFWETPKMMARRSLANEQAKDMLEVVDKEGRAVTDFEVLQVLRLWDFRENDKRQNVMKEGETFVYSDTMGIVAQYTGVVSVKEECRRYPAFGRLLNRWLKDNLPADLGAEFVYTSININKNYAAQVHRDGNNMGPSLIKAFGDFSGGELRYHPEDDKSCGIPELDASESTQVDISSGLLLFDGKRAHFVNDFEGERYSLVFFTCPRHEKLSEENMAYMRAADFPYPTEDTMSKVTNLLRKPKGKEAKEAQEETTPSIHDAPFVFWPHASPERSEREAQAEEYWKARGIRNRIEKVKGFGKFTFEDDDAHAKWSNSCFFVLPSEPARTDLILKQFNNRNDAAMFLNKADSEVPEAVVEAGCCAVRSERTSSWYALYKHDKKSQALAIFGLEKAPCTSSSTKEDSRRTQQPVTTPNKKRKMAPCSAEKTKPKMSEALAVDLQVGDALEVQEKVHSCNEPAGADIPVGQRGTVKKINGTGDVVIHFYDHTEACHWVTKSDFGKLKKLPTPPIPMQRQNSTGNPVLCANTEGEFMQSVGAQVGTLQRKPMVATNKAKDALKQKMAKFRKANLAKPHIETASVEGKDGGPPQQQTPPAVPNQKNAVKKMLGKFCKAPSPKSPQGETQQTSAAANGPPKKKHKASKAERQALEALASCVADAQIEYKPDGKTATSHPKTYLRYATYSKAKTFPEALALGADSEDILYDYKIGALNIIDNGSPSAVWDPRHRKLCEKWKRRAESES